VAITALKLHENNANAFKAIFSAAFTGLKTGFIPSFTELVVFTPAFRIIPSFISSTV
jgi:hypothetical protein